MSNAFLDKPSVVETPRKYSAGWATFLQFCPNELWQGWRDTWRNFLG
jgi:hypothetical protein